MKKAELTLILISIMLLLTSSFVSAATIYGSVAGGIWNEPLSWSSEIVPNQGDDVVIGGGPISSTLDVTINSLTLDSSGDALTLYSGTFTIGVDCINDDYTGAPLCWDRQDSVTPMDWYDAANSYCPGNGARLPTIEELILFATKGQVIYMERGGYLYGYSFDLRPWLVERGYKYTGASFYWSSSGCLGPLCSPKYVWGVDFSIGYHSTLNLAGPANQVRCVRDGQ